MKIRKFFIYLHCLPFRTGYLLPLILLLLIGLLYQSQGNSLFKAFSFSKPKPITQSSTFLSADVQKTIEEVAKQQIQDEQRQANLTSTGTGVTIQPSQVSLDSPFYSLTTVVPTLVQAFTLDPVEKAKIRLKLNYQKIFDVVKLLEKDSSERAVQTSINTLEAVSKDIENLAADKTINTNPQILGFRINLYINLQLLLQKVEDKLPTKAYLKIEKTRQEQMAKLAKTLLTVSQQKGALEKVIDLAEQAIGREVGQDFQALKAVEIITDLEANLPAEVISALHQTETLLTADFEKQMLKLPQGVREKKLLNYVAFSYGNPIRQIQSFQKVKQLLTQREMILGVPGLKEKALQKLESRLLSLDETEMTQFLDTWAQGNFEDLRALWEMELRLPFDQNDPMTAKVKQLRQLVEKRLSDHLDKVLSTLPKQDSPDLIDVLAAGDLARITKDTKKIDDQLVKQKFISSISNKTNADARLLIPAPLALPKLQQIGATSAIPAIVNLVSYHLLNQVSDPKIFLRYKTYFDNDKKLQAAVIPYLNKQTLTKLNQKAAILETQQKKQNQELYERVQMITQYIFTQPSLGKYDQNFSSDLKGKISSLKQTLPSGQIPTLKTPPGVVLPKVAKLPNEVQKAFETLAKQRLLEKSKPEELIKDEIIDLKSLGNAPLILPDSLLYQFKELVWNLRLILSFDKIAQAKVEIERGKSKIVESAILIKRGDARSVDLGLKIFEQEGDRYIRYAALAKDLLKLKLTRGKELEQLLIEAVDISLKKQTVLSTLEGKLHGEDFIRAEKIRQLEVQKSISTILIVAEKEENLLSIFQTVVTSKDSSQFKPLKGIEVLVELERTATSSLKKLLKSTQQKIARDFEAALLKLPLVERKKKLAAYVLASSGNPLRQFEAYEVLKENFKSPDLKLFVESLKEKSVKKLEERLAEVSDQGVLREELINQTLGTDLKDVKAITEIALRVTPVQGSVASLVPNPIVDQIAEAKATVEQNLLEKITTDAVAFKSSDLVAELTNTPDIVDVKVVRDLVEAVTSSNQAVPEVVQELKNLENTVTKTFIEEAKVDELIPAPAVIEILKEIQQQVSPVQQAEINTILSAEVKIIDVHLTTQVDDAVALNTYQNQIQQDPVVSQVVQAVDPTLENKIETVVQVVETNATQQEQQLTETINQVQQEVFSTSQGQTNTTESSLSQIVQQAVEEVKQEIPAEQIPVATPAPEVPISTPAPAPVPVEIQPAPQATSAPAPAAPEVVPQAPAIAPPAAPAL